MLIVSSYRRSHNPRHLLTYFESQLEHHISVPQLQANIAEPISHTDPTALQQHQQPRLKIIMAPLEPNFRVQYKEVEGSKIHVDIYLPAPKADASKCPVSKS